MLPFLKPGDSVFVSSIPYLFSKPKRGDVVIVVREEKFIIKRISKINGDEFILSGDNKTDSKDFEFVKREEIRGKIVLK